MATSVAKQLVRWLDELGRISDERGRLTRTFLSPAMGRANGRVAQWMRGAGLTVRQDAVGNVIGRLETAGSPLAGAVRARASALACDAPKTLLLGSHLDTVRDAGKFDGALGVLLPIAALAEVRRLGLALPFAVEVIGFSEEEGVRFASAYLGSKGYTGRLEPTDLRLRDADGVSMRQAMARWSGLTSSRFGRVEMQLEVKPLHLLGYLEVHIEQGPVLEAEKLAVGVVSAIAGQTRARLRFRGRAGHAGTTPMALRRDALAGAAEFMVVAEGLAKASAPLVATVGTISAAPGTPNVIPGEVVMSLDVRHPRDPSRQAALKILKLAARKIARTRGLGLDWTVTQDHGAVTCSPALTTLLEESVRRLQPRGISLVSGAGHDGVVISRIAPIAMLFVRCRDGLSHHPDEFASRADIDVALRVVIDFLERLANSGGELVRDGGK